MIAPLKLEERNTYLLPAYTEVISREHGFHDTWKLLRRDPGKNLILITAIIKMKLCNCSLKKMRYQMWKKTSQMCKNRESVDVEKACVVAALLIQVSELCSAQCSVDLSWCKKKQKTINCDTKFASDTSCTSLISPRHPRHQKQLKQNKQWKNVSQHSVTVQCSAICNQNTAQDHPDVKTKLK